MNFHINLGSCLGSILNSTFFDHRGVAFGINFSLANVTWQKLCGQPLPALFLMNLLIIPGCGNARSRFEMARTHY
jgi:hypothetical protein